MRLIDADALMQATCDGGICSDCEDVYKGQNIHANCSEIRLVFLRIINDAPTIDIDRPQGKWVRSHEGTIAEGLYCSNCGKHGYGQNFCPNCGADMREREE